MSQQQTTWWYWQTKLECHLRRFLSWTENTKSSFKNILTHPKWSIHISDWMMAWTKLDDILNHHWNQSLMNHLSRNMSYNFVIPLWNYAYSSSSMEVKLLYIVIEIPLTSCLYLLLNTITGNCLCATTDSCDSLWYEIIFPFVNPCKINNPCMNVTSCTEDKDPSAELFFSVSPLPL